MRQIPFIFIVTLCIGITSCDSTHIFEENQSCENNSWCYDDIKTFEIPIQDTLSPMNILINLRTTTDYPYSNIYMFMYSEYPNGEAFKDTLQFDLAESDGKWKGDNSGTVVEFQGMIGQGYFSKAGNYVFKLQHGMREECLDEVVDVGIRIELMEQ